MHLKYEYLCMVACSESIQQAGEAMASFVLGLADKQIEVRLFKTISDDFAWFSKIGWVCKIYRILSFRNFASGIRYAMFSDVSGYHGGNSSYCLPHHPKMQSPRFADLSFSSSSISNIFWNVLWLVHFVHGWLDRFLRNLVLDAVNLTYGIYCAIFNRMRDVLIRTYLRACFAIPSLSPPSYPGIV